MGRVGGKVAVVTGAARGIGQAVSLLVKEGAKVALTDVSDEAGRTLATELSSSTGHQWS